MATAPAVVRGAFVLALVLGGSASCRRDIEPPAPTAPPPSRTPVDQARPGELAEGKERAFGFPIPRRMRIEARFPDAVFAIGDIGPELLANYVRARVEGARVETGPAKTVFSGARVSDAGVADAGAVERIVRIEVTSKNGATELLVRDQTREPAPAGLSEEERWKRLGLKPNGRPLDPTRLE